MSQKFTLPGKTAIRQLSENGWMSSGSNLDTEIKRYGPFVHQISATIWSEPEPPYFPLAQSILGAFEQYFLVQPATERKAFEGLVFGRKHYCWETEGWPYRQFDISIWIKDHPLYDVEGFDPRHKQGRAMYRSIASKAALDYILQHGPKDIELVDLVGAWHVPYHWLSYQGPQNENDGKGDPNPWEFHAEFVGTTISPIARKPPKGGQKRNS
ncbi:hypothetical protein [Dyella sp.]|uniref:hypothetical protein n=1 Tax=Dyella sp. TaxID=1869338 RepID=UPI002847E5D3|nr:hypothetical protein [Dyella sp.]MDR3446931.1 hypothetical protein [Dyella sp.]